MAAITISHHIYLTKEERYKLYNKELVETIGVSLPVWFHKGTTSEPAQEVFCKYKIMNESSNKVIMPIEEGYCINLQQAKTEENPAKKLLDLSEGGAEYFEFRQYNKAHQGKKQFNIVHFVEIKPWELLINTIT